MAAHVLEGSSLERRALLLTQLGYDPNYGGIVGVSESMRQFYHQEAPPFGTPGGMLESDLTVSEGQDSASPGDGDPAPELPLASAEEEEEEEEVEETVLNQCECTTYDWCLCLSCKLSVLVPPLRMPLRERKCLRSARTEGWRLLWSLVLPLAVGSVPLQLVWVVAQLVTSLALFGLSVAECLSASDCKGRIAACASVSCLWMTLTFVDTIFCLVAVQSYRDKFLWKISPFITILRVMYTVICLYIIVIGFIHFSGPSTVSQLSRAQIGLSLSSLGIFVDFILLVVAVQLTRKSFKIRSAYYYEVLYVFHVASEITIHLLFLALYVTVLPFFFQYPFYFCCIGTNWFTVYPGLLAGLSIVLPLFGLLSIYFIDYFWFQGYLVSVCLSVQRILQDRDRVARLGIPVNVCERLQVRLQEIDPDLLNVSIKKFKGKVTFIRRLVHVAENPVRLICSLFPFGLLLLAFAAIFTTFGLFEFSPVAYVAAIMFALIHCRVIVIGLVFLTITPLLIALSPLLMLLCLSVYMICLLCPQCTPQNYCRCCCQVDFVP